MCLCNLLSRQKSSVFSRFLFFCYILVFIFCAAVINKMRSESDLSELPPSAFSFPIFLFQALMPLLRLPPQVIGSQYLPLGIWTAQIQPRYFFWVWIKSEISLNKLLLHTRLIGQFDLNLNHPLSILQMMSCRIILLIGQI